MTGRFSIERDAELALTQPQLAKDVTPQSGAMGKELQYIDESQLWLKDTFRPVKRWLALVIIALAFLPMAFWVWNLSESQKAQEIQMLQLLDDEMLAFGEDYIKNQIEGGDRTLPLIWPDRKLSLSEYIYYDFVLSPGGLQAHMMPALFALVAIIAGLFGAWWFWRLPRNGPLIFDRDRKAAYLMRGETLLITPWDQLSYVQRSWEFGWYLHDENGQKSLILMNLPKGGQGALSRSAGETVIARIAAFMTDGASALRAEKNNAKAPYDISDQVRESIDQRLSKRRDDLA